MGQVISEALMNLLSVQNLIFVNVGIFIGIIFGAIPGMNGNLAITVLLPFTFQMDTVPALLMLTAIFFGANFGGSISSILINTPGTNAAAATLIDGYPMCSNRGSLFTFILPLSILDKSKMSLIKLSR